MSIARSAFRLLSPSAVILLALSACSDEPASPEAAPPAAQQPEIAFTEVGYVASPDLETLASGSATGDEAPSSINVAGVGGNSGNRGANTIFARGDLSGTITRIHVGRFNALSPTELRAAFDVLLITWRTSPALNADWATRIKPYLDLGGGVVWEDPRNVTDLAPAISGESLDHDGPWTVASVPGLTDGVGADFAHSHIRFTSWLPSFDPFVRSEWGVDGLYADFPDGGRMVLTGMDNDYHGQESADGYRLLVNALCWAARMPECAGPAPNRAPSADAGGPYTGHEGAAVAFDGRGSADPDDDPLSYRWDFGDGAAGTGATPAHAYADNGTYTATLTVDDGRGGTASHGATVTIANVPPRPDAGADTTIYSGQRFTFAGVFSDPGILDAPWAYAIDWDEKAPAAESESSSTVDRPDTIIGSHTYLAAGNYDLSLAVTDKDADTGIDVSTVTVARLPLAIDIKPEDSPNSVNPRSRGVIAVAITTGPAASGGTFDATEVDPATVRFGPGGAIIAHARGHQEDVDDDGDADIVLHFRTPDVGIACGDTQATLTGATVAGIEFAGTDSIRTVGCDAGGGGS